MKEWYRGTELIEIYGMPGSTHAIANKAKRNNWLKRKASGQGSAYEFHISSFHEDVQESLIEIYGTDLEKNDVIDTIKVINDNGAMYKSLTHANPVHTNEPNVSSIHKTKPVQNSDTIDIPEYNVQAAAGAGCLTNSEFKTGVFTVSKELVKSLGLRPEYTAIVFCSGDSMLPTMSDGDRILVDTRELTEPVKDGIYVISIDDMVYVKRLKWNILNQSYSVVSDNPEHDSFELAGKDLKRMIINGRAAMAMRAL